MHGEKTRKLAIETVNPRTLANAVTTHAEAREILRSADVVQSGSGIAEVEGREPEKITLFFVEGEEHRRRRAAIAPFFTPKAIDTRYQPIMTRTAECLVAQIGAAKLVRLDQLAFEFAVAVAAEVLGLDHSDLPRLTASIEATINQDETSNRPIKRDDDETLLTLDRDHILPAIEARRHDRREDVISQLLDDGRSDTFISTEVRSYAFAGMVTTRELIVMCTWYLLEDAALLARFRAADRREQLAIIDEILRLEPIVGYIRRRAARDVELQSGLRIAAGTSITIDVRKANADIAEVGPDPYGIDPGRGGKGAPGSGYMSFGDGPHRCPGAQLGLAEARTFIDHLVRLPGLRLVGEPKLAWFKPIASYAFLEARIACD